MKHIQSYNESNNEDASIGDIVYKKNNKHFNGLRYLIINKNDSNLYPNDEYTCIILGLNESDNNEDRIMGVSSIFLDLFTERENPDTFFKEHTKLLIDILHYSNSNKKIKDILRKKYPVESDSHELGLL